MDRDLREVMNAEATLEDLAGVIFQTSASGRQSPPTPNGPGPSLEARYRVLLDQIPAVVFMAYLDEGISGAGWLREVRPFSQQRA